MERLAEIYEAICELEDKEHVNSIKAKKYISLCKEAETIIKEKYDGWGLEELIKERQGLEEDLAEEGYISATKCNLGARIQIHLVCKENNLFGKTEGWTYCNKIGKHWVIGNKTLCEIKDITYDGEPNWSGFRGCIKCKKVLFYKLVKEDLKQYPAIPENTGHSRSAYGVDCNRSNGVFRLEESEIKSIKKKNGEYDSKRVTKILYKIPDIGYGKITEKEFFKR